MNTDGRRFCFKSPANASQRHHPSHHSSSWFIILKRIMIHHKNMIHSSHYSRFWNKQHIGWQDILRKRNGAQLRPASLPCRGAVVHHDYHLPTPFSHRSVSLGQTQRRWKYPRCGCVCVCVKEPWLFNSFSLWEQGWISQKHGVCPCFGKGRCHNVPTACSKCFQCFLNRLVVPVSSCFTFFFSRGFRSSLARQPTWHSEHSRFWSFCGPMLRPVKSGRRLDTFAMYLRERNGSERIYQWL